MNLALHQQISLLPPSILWHKDETPLAANETALLTADRRVNSMRAATEITERVTVYKITCLVNGKEYVGITARTAAERWKEAIDEASRPKSKRAIIKAIRKHGPENFIVEEIAVAFGRDAANTLERAFIVEFDCLHPRGYNLSTGGEGSVGRRVTEEGRAHVREGAKALWADSEWRARTIASFQNRVIPEFHIEHLRRLAAEQKGKPRPREAVEKGRASQIGHQVSAETRAKISAAGRGTKAAWWTPERRAARAEIIRQRHAEGAYEGVAAKTSDARKALWADPVWRAERSHEGKKRGPYKPRSPKSDRCIK